MIFGSSKERGCNQSRARFRLILITLYQVPSSTHTGIIFGVDCPSFLDPGPSPHCSAWPQGKCGKLGRRRGRHATVADLGRCARTLGHPTPRTVPVLGYRPSGLGVDGVGSRNGDGSGYEENEAGED